MSSPFNPAASASSESSLNQPTAFVPAQPSGALYESAYPGAPGAPGSAMPTAAAYESLGASPASAPAGGSASGLESQGLTLIQQGDQYNGIMDLLQASSMNPGLPSDPTFLSQLQSAENVAMGSNSAAGTSPYDATATATPTSFDANGNPIYGSGSGSPTSFDANGNPISGSGSGSPTSFDANGTSATYPNGYFGNTPFNPTGTPTFDGSNGSSQTGSPVSQTPSDGTGTAAGATQPGAQTSAQSALAAAESQAVNTLQTNPAQGVYDLMQLCASDQQLATDPTLLSNVGQMFGTYTAPPDSSTFTSALQSGNAAAAESQAFADGQTSPLLAISELMQLAAADPAIMQDPNLQANLQQWFSPSGGSSSTGQALGAAPPSSDVSGYNQTPTGYQPSTGGTGTGGTSGLDATGAPSTPASTSMGTNGVTSPLSNGAQGGTGTDSGISSGTPTGTDATGTQSPTGTTGLDTTGATGSTGAPGTTAGTLENQTPQAGTVQSGLPGSTAGTSALTAAEQQALQDLQTNPAQGILELLQLVSQNPGLLQDANLQTALDQLFGQSQPPQASAQFTQDANSGNAQAAESQALQDLQSNPFQGLVELMTVAASQPQMVQDPSLAQALQQKFGQPANPATGAGTTNPASGAGTTNPASGSTGESGVTNPTTGVTNPTTGVTNPLTGSSSPSSLAQAEQQALSDLKTNPVTGIIELMQIAGSDPQALQDTNLQQNLLQMFGQTTLSPSTGFMSQHTVGGAENQALQDFQSNPLQGIVELMQIASEAPQAAQDPTLQQELQQLLGQTATSNPSTGTTGLAGTGTGSDAGTGTTGATGAPGATGIYGSQTSPTGSINPSQASSIENQAFQMMQGGNMTQGVALLMQLANADPQITQDPTFQQNLKSVLAQVKGANGNAAPGTGIAGPGTNPNMSPQSPFAY